MLGTREIEQRLLGALLVYSDAIHGVRDTLTRAHFEADVHAAIWSTMDLMAAEGLTIDRSIIVRRCYAEPRGASLPVYLAQLYSNAPDESQIDDLVKELIDAEMRRSARAVLEGAAKVMDTTPDARAKLEEVQNGVARILSATRAGGGQIGQLCDKLLKEIWSPPKERPRRIKTGFAPFDKVAGAMAGGDLIVLGGATSAGKTALAAQLAEMIAERANTPHKDYPDQMLGVPVLYISLEMEPDQIGGRLLARRAGFPLWRIEQDELNDAERHRVLEAQREFNQVPLYIETISRATPESILALVMKFQKTHGIGIVFVDHLHYVRSSNRKLDRFAAIEDVVMEFKANAKQTKIPWFCLAHLNREIGKRPDKRPHMNDLYGASEMEKSADVVAFVHREAYWLTRDKPREGSAEYQVWFDALYGAMGTPENPASDGLINKAEIIVEKRRRGRGVGSCMCEFDENLTVFR